MIKENKNQINILFVESLEFGHAVSHLTAIFESIKALSYLYKKFFKINLLISKNLFDNLLKEYGKNLNKFDIYIKSELFVNVKYRKFKQIQQIILFVKQKKCRSVCFLYLDDIIFYIPLIKIRYPFIKLSGIFFRPMLHYYTKMYPKQGISKFYWIIMWCKNLLLLIFLRVGILNTCFFQDEGAIESYSSKRGKGIWIPTPVNDNSLMSPSPKKSIIRFLIFGQIAKRKGIYRVFETWKHLPVELRNSVELWIIGRVDPTEKTRVINAIESLKYLGWKIHFDDRFIETKEIREIFKNIDVVLSPHDLQFGTSGITVQSAIWRRPIIVHDFGWVGFTVKKYRLGLAIDTSKPSEFTQTVEKFISDKSFQVNISDVIAHEFLVKHQRHLLGEKLLKGIL